MRHVCLVRGCGAVAEISLKISKPDHTAPNVNIRVEWFEYCCPDHIDDAYMKKPFNASFAPGFHPAFGELLAERESDEPFEDDGYRAIEKAAAIVGPVAWRW